MVAYVVTSTLSPCAVLSHVQTPMLTDPPDITCTQDLDCAGGITAAAVTEALADADVQQALADAPVVRSRRRCVLLPLRVLQAGVKSFAQESDSR